MKKLVLGFTICLLASSALAGDGFSARNAGEWRGVGVQACSESWVVHVKMGPDLVRVDYPALRCGGIWEYGVELGNLLSLTERLEFGQDLCFDNSRVVLEGASNSHLAATWYDKNDAEIGFAVLHRADPALSDFDIEHAETLRIWLSRNPGFAGHPACALPTG